MVHSLVTSFNYYVYDYNNFVRSFFLNTLILGYSYVPSYLFMSPLLCDGRYISGL